MDIALRIGIEKNDGRFFGPSCEILQNSWGFLVGGHAGSRGSEILDLVRMGKPDDRVPRTAKLFALNIEDILSNVRDGELDFCVVDNETMTAWEEASKEILREAPDIIVADAGPANNPLMLAVAQEYLDRHGSEPTAWEQAVRFSAMSKKPIYTTSSNETAAFLMASGITDLPILRQRRNRITPQAWVAGALVVTAGKEDLRNSDYEPVVQIRENRVLIVARLSPDAPMREVQMRMLQPFGINNDNVPA